MKTKRKPGPKAKVKSGGKGVAKPKQKARKKDDFIGRLNGTFRIVGDIVSPVVPLEDWECLKEFDEFTQPAVTRGVRKPVKR